MIDTCISIHELWQIPSALRETERLYVSVIRYMRILREYIITFLASRFLYATSDLSLYTYMIFTYIEIYAFDPLISHTIRFCRALF
jgi:hypothetical protein